MHTRQCNAAWAANGPWLLQQETLVTPHALIPIYTTPLNNGTVFKLTPLLPAQPTHMHARTHAHKHSRALNTFATIDSTNCKRRPYAYEHRY